MLRCCALCNFSTHHLFNENENSMYIWSCWTLNHFKVVLILISPRSPLIYIQILIHVWRSGNKSDISRLLLKWKLSIHNKNSLELEQDFWNICYKTLIVRLRWLCWWGPGPRSSPPGPRLLLRARPWTWAAAQRAAPPPLTSSGTWRWERETESQDITTA